MAQITLLTVGSRGDIQPFCAIAHALIQRGHTVTLAASFNFANFAAQQHIPFAPIAGDFKQILGSPAGIDLLEGDTSVTLIEDDLLWQQLTESWEACQGCALLIFSPLSLWGYHIAEALKVPAILATAVPVAATAEFPFLQFTKRTQSRLSGLLNQLSYRLVSTLGWRRSANLINRFRTEALHLRKLPWPGALYRKEKPPFLSPLPLVHCYSESVIPPAADWGSSVHQAGYCFLETAKSFSPSPALKAFLEKSPQPFYIGFGSMIARNPKQLAKTILSALAASGGDALIYSNELVDAFPAKWLRWSAELKAWQEIMVAYDSTTGLREVFRDLPKDLDRSVFSAMALADLSEGQRIEIQPSYQQWLTEIAAEWKSGAMLTIDYGGSAEEIYHRRRGGTLRGYYRQERVEGGAIYQRVGKQDLTVDVNFTDLIQWGEALGWKTVRDETQREFLSEFGFAADTMAESAAGSAFRVLEHRLV